MHAFAVDPLRGVFVLVLLALAVGGALTLYALRAPGLPESPIFAPLSRESFLLINNLFLATACATLATGTLYPLLLTAVGGGTVSVGAPYFNATVLPLMMPVAALMIVGPLLNWEKNRVVAQEPLKIALIAVVAAQGIGLYLYGFKSFLGLLALMLGTWVIAGTLADAYRLGDARRAQRPRLLAHIGFGVAVIGMSGAAFSDVHTFSMRPHDTTEIAGYRIELESVAPVEGPNFSALRGLFRITHEGQAITMQPERRYYPSQGTLITDVAIHTNLIGDLYLVLGAPEDENEDADQARYTVRLHINPLVPWIWLGAAIMALGGVAGVLQKKR